MRTSVRGSVLGAVLMVGTALLTGCGSQPAGGAAAPAPASEAAATGSVATTPEELRNALLPASAFGPDATVIGLSLDQLGQLPGLGELPEGTSAEPAPCGAALAMVPRAAADLPTLVARGAWTGEVRSLEVLADGPAMAGLRLPVDQLLATCAQMTVTAADGPVTTVGLTALDTPALGDAAAGLTVTVTRPQGTVSALVGVVSLGSRAVLLVQVGGAGAVPDEAGFTALLTQATDAAS
jgi:hypothetical protein